MKKKLTVFLIALFVLGISFAIVPKKANAIPAFAQKYHFSCAVCHTVFPNLNPFGRAFWRNGFRLPGTNGTPADATQITQGLSLPNPWPIPIMIEPIIGYTHNGNENIYPRTDAFSAEFDLVAGGVFKVYTPFLNSISFYVHENTGNGTMRQKQVFASLNGILSGCTFGIAPQLLNLKIGQVTTASPYFYRQMPFYIGAGPVGAGAGVQGLAVGYDGEVGSLIHSRNEGIALYGTPGFHLWYKATVTNDNGGNQYNLTNNPGTQASNAMEYSYQLKEYYPLASLGQLEFGYYGATIGEPMSTNGISETYNNRVTVNGLDVDLSNDVYEIGATWMEQNDSNPYGPNGITYYNPNGTYAGSQSSNGYSDFEVYGRYLFPQIGNGLMLSADYATYSFSHKGAQEAYNGTYGAACPDANLYGSAYQSGNCLNNGIKNALNLNVEYNLAYNAHLYLEYIFTNHAQDNTLGSGIDIAF
ncbi:MAG: hypothetical protein ACYCTB_04165 [bacterium]